MSHSPGRGPPVPGRVRMVPLSRTPSARLQPLGSSRRPRPPVQVQAGPRPPWTQARSGAVHGQRARQPRLPHLPLPPPERGRRRRGAGIPPAAPLTRGYPGPSPTRPGLTPGPQGSAGQAVGPALSTLDFRGPQHLSQESRLLKVPAPSTLGELASGGPGPQPLSL